MFTEPNRRLLKEDYNKSCQDLAVYLLGKVLVRKLQNGEFLKGRIVETECYLGGEDKASHSYNGKMTKRNEPMYMPAGTLYVYTIYFGNHCFNISSIEPGAVVLLRSLQPISGIYMMEKFRGTKSRIKNSNIKTINLANGPSKLCMAMNVTKENANKLELTNVLNDYLWIEDDTHINELNVVNTARIGIGLSAEEWVMKPLRYYILNNKFVSRRDKNAEKYMVHV